MAKSAPPTPHSKTTAPASTHTSPAEAADATSLQPPTHDGVPQADAVRARAHALWQQAGEPGGDGTEFWLRAEQELRNGR